MGWFSFSFSGITTTKEIVKHFYYKVWSLFWNPMPELGTLMPMTFSANIFIPYTTEGIVILPPNAGIYPAPSANTWHWKLSL